MLGLSFCRAPDFWEEPWEWLRIHWYGRESSAITIVLLVAAGLLALRSHFRQVAHLRATTPDGPDADYRELA